MPGWLAAWTILVRQWRLHGRTNIDGENLGVVSRAQDKDSELNSGVSGKKQMHLFFWREMEKPWHFVITKVKVSSRLGRFAGLHSSLFTLHSLLLYSTRAYSKSSFIVDLRWMEKPGSFLTITSLHLSAC